MPADDRVQERAQLLEALSGLAALIRDEYPAGYSVAEIASTWGRGLLTPEQIRAIAALDAEGLL